jgi:hypothetical protein
VRYLALTLPVLITKHRRLTSNGMENRRLKFILRISQNMQHPKSIQIGHISNSGYPQIARRYKSYPREICLRTQSW